MPANKPLPFKRRKRTKEHAKRLKASTSSEEISKPKELQSNGNMLNLANLCEDDTENHCELLYGQTIMEGMIILGCVIAVKKDCFIMSLPGCLKGSVPLTNISDTFTKRYNKSYDDLSPLDLHSAIKLGMTFPCKVMKVVPGTFPQKTSILLSVNPKDVNENLRPQTLYQKMVLFASVSSQEDFGYIMDVGGKGITAFLKYNTENKINCPLEVGQVIPTQSRSIVSHEGTSSVQLAQLNFNEPFPLIEEENIRLTSILPGANVIAYITEIKHPFVYMKCLDFKACAFLMSSGSSYKNLTVANKVCGTVLYVHPFTHMIHLHLGPKPTPGSFSKYFGVKKYDLVQNVKFQCLYRNKAYCRIPRGYFGYVKKREFKGKKFSIEKLQETSFCRARVMHLHFMDNIVHLTLNKSMVNQEVKKKEDFKIGDTCEGFVKKHVGGGMFVFLCPGVSGFVRRLHLADVCLTKTRPETLYPLKTKVTCRVLKSDSSNLVQLTLKKSLLTLLQHEILKSYEDAVSGRFYKGVIVSIKENYVLVLFFNDVKGIVSSEDIPQGAIYFVGQTVQCEVLHSNPQQKKMKLSLKIKGSSDFEEELYNRVKDEDLDSRLQDENMYTKLLNEDSDSKLQDEDTDSMVQDENIYTKLLNEGSDSMIQDEDLDSMVQDENIYTKLLNEDSNSMVQDEDSNSMVQDEDSNSMVQDEDLDSMVQDENLDSMVQDENIYTRLLNEDSDSMVQDEDLDTMVQDEDLDTMVQDGDLHNSLRDGNIYTQVLDEELNSWLHDEDFCCSIRDENLYSKLLGKDLDSVLASCSSRKKMPSEESEDLEWLDPYGDIVKTFDNPNGNFSEAKVMKIMGHQLIISFGENLTGRVHISEIGCTKEGEYPLREFTVGQDIKVHVFGEFYHKGAKHLEVTHRRMLCKKDCSLKFPEPVSLTVNFCSGMRVMGYIKEVHETSAICWLSPKHIGILDYLNFSNSPKELRKLKKKLHIGLSVRALVLNVNNSPKKDNLSCSIVLTKLGTNLPSAGSNVVGLFQNFFPVDGLILKLPNGYHGSVALCNIQDNYEPLDSVIKKYKKMKFILCHVLYVNWETKFCHLSLRKSRLYKKNTENGQFCPELSKNDMKKGNIVKGYVTSVCDKFISIHLSITLAGQIPLHSCHLQDCSSCQRSKLIKLSHPIGSVAVAVVEECASEEEHLYNLSFIEHDSSYVMSPPERLNLKKDVVWDDL